MMGDFNTKTVLKPRGIVTKQMLPLRDSRPPQPKQLNCYKETLQLRSKKELELPTGKTLLELRPRRCDSRQEAFKSRASSPHSLSSGYATEEHDSDHHDGDSSTGSQSSEHHGESSWMSTTQFDVMQRRMAEAAWTAQPSMPQNGKICPVVCGLCGASGGSAHSAKGCPLRRRHLFHCPVVCGLCGASGGSAHSAKGCPLRRRHLFQ